MYTYNNVNTDNMSLFEIGFIVDALNMLSCSDKKILQQRVTAHARQLSRENYVIPMRNLHGDEAKVYFSYVAAPGNINLLRLELPEAKKQKKAIAA